MHRFFLGALLALWTGSSALGQSTATTNDLKIVSRREWQAKDPIEAMKPHVLKFITIHHTGTKSKKGPVAVKLQHLQVYSQREELLGNGKRKPAWPDVPYHFYITIDGEIGEGRDIRFVGDTNTEYDPTGHILVTLEGNFEEEDPGKAQMESARKLVTWLAAKYQIPQDKIKTHKDYAKTACPGKKLYERMDELKKSLP